MYDTIFDEVLALLLPLERVTQARRYHPEGDALFHSLQVYGLARQASEDPALWAAALLHDVGKAAVCSCHAEQGAAMLEGIADDRVRWLVAHHLELLHAPRECRALLRGDNRLTDLEALRAWDLAGRQPQAAVVSAERAVGEILEPGVAEQWLCEVATVEDAEG